MPTAKLYAPTGEQQGTIELPEWAFGSRIARHAMWEAVRNYLANQRLGTHAVKNRALVSGGGKKPWSQKKTGRARSGSNRSPIWVGGGRAFGPQPRSYSYELPKKTRRLALRSALTLKARGEQIDVLSDLPLQQAKTREVYQVLRNIGASEQKILLVLPEHDPRTLLAARNLPKVRTAVYRDLNTYQVLHSDRLVLLESTVNRMRETEVGK
ncbi:MAG: 50S ribosomal protein L4 [Candidatus Eisenbacteria bacterium]